MSTAQIMDASRSSKFDSVIENMMLETQQSQSLGQGPTNAV